MHNYSSYSIFKKKKLIFIRPRSNDIFNVYYQKVLIFLTRFCVGLSHLKENKFKYSLLDTLILSPFVVLMSKH